MQISRASSEEEDEGDELGQPLQLPFAGQPGAPRLGTPFLNFSPSHPDTICTPLM